MRLKILQPRNYPNDERFSGIVKAVRQAGADHELTLLPCHIGLHPNCFVLVTDQQYWHTILGDGRYSNLFHDVFHFMVGQQAVVERLQLLFRKQLSIETEVVKE